MVTDVCLGMATATFHVVDTMSCLPCIQASMTLCSDKLNLTHHKAKELVALPLHAVGTIKMCSGGFHP